MTIEPNGDGRGQGGTVVFRGSFHRTRRERSHNLAPGPGPDPVERPAATGPWTGKRPANVAALLALAHHVQRLIDAGRITDRAEVARRLHWTRARVSQVMDLLLLAPDIQEEVLFLEAGTRVTERALRSFVRREDWHQQRVAWSKLVGDAAGRNESGEHWTPVDCNGLPHPICVRFESPCSPVYPREMTGCPQ
jgi:hypothetical protein